MVVCPSLLVAYKYPAWVFYLFHATTQSRKENSFMVFASLRETFGLVGLRQHGLTIFHDYLTFAIEQSQQWVSCQGESCANRA